MTSSRMRRGRVPLVAMALLGALLAPAVSAQASESANAVGDPGAQSVAPGVTYRTFTVTTAHGPATGYLVTADLTNPKVDLGLLHPDAVAARDTVSDMADAQHAVAGVNGDTFNISETHVGVDATGSAVGPEIADGKDLKAAVPNGQRFGPGMAPGTSTLDVFGVGADHRARVSSVSLTGTLTTDDSTFSVEGLNQYAVAVNGIGVYTADWGTVSRLRATCGTDTVRTAPCSTDTEEVVVQRGVVTSMSEAPGAGAIAVDTTVLVGREAGADELRTLKVGDHVSVHTRLTTADNPPFKFALGGAPILRDGAPLSKLDPTTLAPRTSAGVSADGRTVYLLAIDGRTANSTGMTIAEVADLMHSFGAADAVNLDGGGSTTLATRDLGQSTVTVRNTPSDGTERAVANGIGVFSSAR